MFVGVDQSTDLIDKEKRAFHSLFDDYNIITIWWCFLGTRRVGFSYDLFLPCSGGCFSRALNIQRGEKNVSLCSHLYGIAGTNRLCPQLLNVSTHQTKVLCRRFTDAKRYRA